MNYWKSCFRIFTDRFVSELPKKRDFCFFRKYVFVFVTKLVLEGMNLEILTNILENVHFLSYFFRVLFWLYSVTYLASKLILRE